MGLPNSRRVDEDPDSPMTESDREIADIFIEYFCKVFTHESDGRVPSMDFKPLIKPFGTLKYKILNHLLRITWNPWTFQRLLDQTICTRGF